MPFIVAEPCIKCKYTDCVSACPVDCFYEGEDFLVIHPEECVDCGACVPECPAEAIFEQEDLPDVWHGYIELNAILAEKLPNIAEQKEPLPQADQYRELKGKGGLITLPPDLRELVEGMLPAPIDPLPADSAATQPLPEADPVEDAIEAVEEEAVEDEAVEDEAPEAAQQAEPAAGATQAAPPADAPEQTEAPEDDGEGEDEDDDRGHSHSHGHNHDHGRAPAPAPAPQQSAPRPAPSPAAAPARPAGPPPSLLRRVARRVIPSPVRGALKGLLGRG